jgi:hypothetical protein
MARRHYDLLSAIAVLVVIVSGCGTTSPRPVLLDDPLHGMVFLERMPDRSFQAAHPLKQEVGLIARVLRGVYLQPKLRRAFTDEQVDVLAPVIARALGQAEWDQRVGFRLPDGTAGTVYAYGRSLHVTLVPSGREPQELLFFPEAARRPEAYRETGLVGEEPRLAVVINYDLLGKLPDSMVAPPGKTDAPTTVSKVKDKDAELEALKAELQSLREQVKQQEAQIQSLKDGKPKPRNRK